MGLLIALAIIVVVFLSARNILGSLIGIVVEGCKAAFDITVTITQFVRARRNKSKIKSKSVIPQLNNLKDEKLIQTCSACNTSLRIPKNKGLIDVTCPVCRATTRIRT